MERPDLARLTADGDVVVAFSDIEDSTLRNETLGDRGWLKILERHNRLVQNLVGDHGGHVIKSQGDGFMIAFADAGQAVLCAAEIQQALHDDADRWEGIRVRIGCTWAPRSDAATTCSGAMLRWQHGLPDKPVVARSW